MMTYSCINFCCPQQGDNFIIQSHFTRADWGHRRNRNQGAAWHAAQDVNTRLACSLRSVHSADVSGTLRVTSIAAGVGSSVVTMDLVLVSWTM